MVFGGIPYYMGYVRKNLSFAQNVDQILFSKRALLGDEFDRLFESIFDNPEQIKAVVRMLFTKNAGYTRNEIINRLHLSNSGHLSKHLKALISSGFVTKYVPFGVSKKEEHYKLTDPFCLFYLHFLEGEGSLAGGRWEQINNTQPAISWRGFAFENVCFNHIDDR